MMKDFMVALLLLPAGLVCFSLLAQNTVVLTDRLHGAEQASSIDGVEISPWHLKLDVQLFDAQGKPSERGTVEEWWASEDLRKVTYTFPSYSGTEVRNQNGAFRTQDATPRPWLLQNVVQQFVHPLKIGELGPAKPDLRKQKFGKMEMDCIMVDQPLKSEALPPLGLFPTYCLEPGKDDLRVTTEFGSVTFIRTRMGRFQNKSVAVEVNGELLGKTAITAQVSALTGAKLTAVDFQETPGMEKTGTGQIRMSGSVIAGSIINKIQPLYPDSAKRNHIQGTVILHGIIGTDGHVHSLHIISTPDPDLAIASIFAVRQWTYKPYLLNGLPTEVDTTMTVNFSFGPG